MPKSKIKKERIMAEVETLTPHEKNYNQHPQSQIEELAQSLTIFGQTKNIVTDETGKILAGHGLVMAAKYLGWKHLETNKYTGLTEEQKYAILIADNALPFGAVPDVTLLDELLEKCKDFKIPGVGSEFLDLMGSRHGEDINIDDFFQDNEPGGGEGNGEEPPNPGAAKNTVTCPHCNKEFDL